MNPLFLLRTPAPTLRAGVFVGWPLLVACGENVQDVREPGTDNDDAMGGAAYAAGGQASSSGGRPAGTGGRSSASTGNAG